MILILKMEDGSTRSFDTQRSITALITAIQRNNVETIIVGAVDGEKVLWEKQFTAVDVMPTDFGKPRTSS